MIKVIVAFEVSFKGVLYVINNNYSSVEIAVVVVVAVAVLTILVIFRI